MEFHPEKSKVLHISNKRNPLKYNYNIHGHILEEAETSKYLGINLNRTLSWNNHINTVAKKAIFLISVLSYKRTYINFLEKAKPGVTRH
jgi:hypothetical protein